VTFYDGATLIGTGILDENGQANFTTTDLVSGVHQITAVYGGDLDNLDSSGAVSYTIVG
jgi:hypothetical protein